MTFPSASSGPGSLTLNSLIRLAAALAGATTALAQIPTTAQDFFLAGTQPDTVTQPLVGAENCANCHGYFDPNTEPFTNWAASMMGQAARDPLYKAALVIANQDADFGGDTCIRCHAPVGWLGGRSTPTDGSMLTGEDFQGVSCSICHRMVNPTFTPGQSPVADIAVLNAINPKPPNPHTGNYIIDPQDRRRGPYDLGDFNTHAWLKSPFHQSSALCATCHDVSNPLFTKAVSGPNVNYNFNGTNTQHPTGSKYDMFPLERTYSEWSASSFALGPIDMGGRFGGNNPLVSSCQDCHMPATTGFGCVFGTQHTDLARHQFNGGNTWVLNAVRNLYSDGESLLTEQSVNDSIARATDMLAKASDLALTQNGSNLNIRITNQTGHKLPTGYPEGRRMWLNVRFFNLSNQLIAERGAYDNGTATLTTADTKVYQAHLAIDPNVAALSGLPAGVGFHFAMNNVVNFDNRIPPRGYTLSGFTTAQAAPVGYSYPDGQYWDDTDFAIPSGAAHADVRLYYQTSSREYIEFLRDTNFTNDDGQTAYDQWLATGQSAPVEMDFQTLTLNSPTCPGDLDGDHVVALNDLAILLSNYGATNATPAMGDLNGDHVVDLSDLADLLAAYGMNC